MIRDLENFAEYEACAALQVEVWRFPEIDVVPAGHLVALAHYGGICMGAFDDSRLVGFVCGFVGRSEARVFHHSHMLAVVPEFRGARLGERLKWAQRDRVLEQGMDLINWTYDPLQALNANLNIERLGCVVRTYIVNLYGESVSPLHGGIPTDRFEAEWQLKSQRVLDARESAERRDRPVPKDLPRVNLTRETEAGLLECVERRPDVDELSESLYLEIPANITDLMAKDRELALDWRIKTRQLFQAYFEKGYCVDGLHRRDGRVFYRLTLEEHPQD